MLRGTLILLGSAALLLAACSSDERREPLAPDCCDAAAVSTARTPEASSSASRNGRTAEPDASAMHAAPAARARPPAGPRDVHADRERVIEDAVAEDRPAGGSEARIEPDGSVYRPGVGILPRYSVKTIDRKDGAVPDSSIMKHVPGNNIELPPPAPKPPDAIPGREEPGGSILVPKEVK